MRVSIGPGTALVLLTLGLAFAMALALPLAALVVLAILWGFARGWWSASRARRRARGHWSATTYYRGVIRTVKPGPYRGRHRCQH